MPFLWEFNGLGQQPLRPGKKDESKSFPNKFQSGASCKTMRIPLLLVVSTLFLALKPANAISPVNKSFFGDVAIKGYDPVSYFESGKAEKGDKAYTFEFAGANWHFASEEHLNQFRKEPEKYAPQFGGYCAWAVSQGYTAGIDPEAWKIVDGKLYLNYSKSVQAKWEKDENNLIAAAEKNWPELLEKE